MSEISQRILRLMDGMSYGALAKATGIPKSALQRYATGQTEKIPIDRLERIAEALQVSSAYLTGWDEETAQASVPQQPADDDAIKFALFGDVDVDDAVYESVKQFARFAQEQARKKGK